MAQKTIHGDVTIKEIFQKAFGDMPFDNSAFLLTRHIHKAFHILEGASEVYLRPHNLTVAKYRMLMWLLACEKAGYSDGLLPSQLSRFNSVSPNTTTSMLHALEEQGLIERRKHPTDNRKTIISISERGRALVERIAEPYMIFAGSFMKGMSEEERQILITLLNKMSGSVQEAVEEYELKCER